MKKGDYVMTPRFCTVKIEDVYENKDVCRMNGYTEPTHYRNEVYGILGKSVGVNRMVFAAYKK